MGHLSPILAPSVCRRFASLAPLKRDVEGFFTEASRLAPLIGNHDYRNPLRGPSTPPISGYLIRARLLRSPLRRGIKESAYLEKNLRGRSLCHKNPLRGLTGGGALNTLFLMGTMRIGSIEDHRAKEEGPLIYPVYSRRSQGLSLGINLFPDQKHCSFDCPYCEVFPFKTNVPFSLDRMEQELRETLTRLTGARDISFSGSGEPTLSPFFPPALEAAFRLREALAP